MAVPGPQHVEGLCEILSIHLVFIAIISILANSPGINVDVLCLMCTPRGISL